MIFTLILIAGLWLLGIPVARGAEMRTTTCPVWYQHGLWPLWAVLATVIAVTDTMRFLYKAANAFLEGAGQRWAERRG